MPAPTVTVLNPPPITYPDGIDGILRPGALVRWTGGVGPFDVLHEWDTAQTFDTPNLLQDSNLGASSPDVGTPPGDLGPAGTTWFYRVTVTDTSDAAATTSSVSTLDWYSPREQRRYLYELANVGVGISPIDAPAAGWGPAPDQIAPDGFAIDARRYLYQLAHVGVGFDPTDETDWGEGSPGDGLTRDHRRYLYQLANVDATTPTPHIWYVYPTFGREGWEFRIVGYGFGDTQATFSGTATLNGLTVGIITWDLVAESDPDLIIDPLANIATPTHQLIRASVPSGASSGLVVVTTDGP